MMASLLEASAADATLLFMQTCQSADVEKFDVVQCLCNEETTMCYPPNNASNDESTIKNDQYKG